MKFLQIWRILEKKYNLMIDLSKFTSNKKILSKIVVMTTIKFVVKLCLSLKTILELLLKFWWKLVSKYLYQFYDTGTFTKILTKISIYINFKHQSEFQPWHHLSMILHSTCI